MSGHCETDLDCYWSPPYHYSAYAHAHRPASSSHASAAPSYDARTAHPHPWTHRYLDLVAPLPVFGASFHEQQLQNSTSSSCTSAPSSQLHASQLHASQLHVSQLHADQLSANSVRASQSTATDRKPMPPGATAAGHESAPQLTPFIHPSTIQHPTMQTRACAANLNTGDTSSVPESGSNSAESRVSSNLKKHALAALKRMFVAMCFVMVRPMWLRNPRTGRLCELDFYCDELRLGVEIQGMQHSVFPNSWCKSRHEWEELIYRDKLKQHLCQQAGVTLIHVPFTVTANRVEQFIRDEIQRVALPGSPVQVWHTAHQQR